MTDDEFDRLQDAYDLCGIDGRLRDFADAIEAEEREACVRWLDNEADRQEVAWNAHLASGSVGPATSLHATPRAYAARLRERSNVEFSSVPAELLGCKATLAVNT